jgi:TRAP-type C4-dicarboxylate transport system permease small subunit
MKWIDRLAAVCAMVAGYGLLGVMLFIVVGVTFRYVLGAPIFGSQDVLEMILIGVTTLGFGYTASTNSHIAVDLFDRAIGPAGRLLGDILARGLGASLLLLIAWGATEKMLDALEWGDATNLLRIPYWPFYAIIILSAALYAVVLLAQLVKMARSEEKVES